MLGCPRFIDASSPDEFAGGFIADDCARNFPDLTGPVLDDAADLDGGSNFAYSLFAPGFGTSHHKAMKSTSQTALRKVMARRLSTAIVPPVE